MHTIVVPAIEKHNATVIFLHGLGDSGMGWRFLADHFHSRKVLSHVKFIFPSAPSKPLTIYGNTVLPSWYDIMTLNPDFADISSVQEDEAGLLSSAQSISELISKEIDSGIASDRIVVGGFSQGCVISLLTGLTFKHKLAGVVGLSGYLPIYGKFKSLLQSCNNDTRVFLGHGDQDPVIQYDWAKKSAEMLKSWKVPVEFHMYAGMGHSASDQVIEDVQVFLNTALPQSH